MITINTKYPLQQDSNNIFAMNYTNVDSVESKIRLLFDTFEGERPFNINYGINLKKFVFEPDTNQLYNKIESEIYDKFKIFTDISLSSVSIQPIEDNQINIKISYIINKSKDVKNIDIQKTLGL